MIYDELLISRKCVNPGSSPRSFDKTLLWIGRSLDFTRNTTPDDDAWPLRTKPDGVGTRRDSDPDTTILRTCRTIAQEASPVLYGNNDFRFGCFSSDRLLVLDCDLREYCNKIFKYTAAEISECKMTALLSFDFAAFLYTIGPVNATYISSLAFLARSADEITACLPVMTRLVALHLPALRCVELRTMGRLKYDTMGNHQLTKARTTVVHRKELPNYWVRDRKALAWSNPRRNRARLNNKGRRMGEQQGLGTGLGGQAE